MSEKEDPKDRPLEELIEMANEFLAKSPEAHFYFKFTCKHCGERVEFNEPNTYYEYGECCLCHKDTKFTKGGLRLSIPIPAKNKSTTPSLN